VDEIQQKIWKNRTKNDVCGNFSPRSIRPTFREADKQVTQEAQKQHCYTAFPGFQLQGAD
jgi:hypothetical protein